ncbi:hypothetical protein [Flavobacterium sp.]|uniref:hypothetical protein n=1 Tax=Flavobacterium sp. TaxID=239 RepID=UPI004034959D
MEDTPIFSNTCGMIFSDRVVFAFDNGEKQIAIPKIKAADFRSRVTPRSILLLFLPLAIAALMDLRGNFHNFHRAAGYGIAIALTLLAIYNIERKYRITIETEKGLLSITVSKNNRKDARNFVNKLKEAAKV